MQAKRSSDATRRGTLSIKDQYWANPTAMSVEQWVEKRVTELRAEEKRATEVPLTTSTFRRYAECGWMARSDTKELMARIYNGPESMIRFLANLEVRIIWPEDLKADALTKTAASKLSLREES